jgi:hypothetical protein
MVEKTRTKNNLLSLFFSSTSPPDYQRLSKKRLKDKGRDMLLERFFATKTSVSGDTNFLIQLIAVTRSWRGYRNQ